MTIKTLKALKNHEAVSGIDISRDRRFVRDHGFPIVVYLKPDYFNAKHAVNVVMGKTAAEVLEFFNGGHVKHALDLNAAEKNALGIGTRP